MQWNYVRFLFFKKIIKSLNFFKGDDYNFVNYISKVGDVSLHTYSHNTNMQANISTWDPEERTVLKDFAGLAQVPSCNIQGSRAPYLQTNDDYFTTLQNLGIRF